MSEGVVRWFNYKKGYGFLSSNEFKEEIFLHHSEFVKEDYLREGSTVTFDMVQGEKGLKAKNIALKE